MVIVQGIKYRFAVSPGTHQPSIFQHSQLMAHRTLGHAQGIRQLLDTQFAGVQLI